MTYKEYDFSADKNSWLKESRNISFEEIIVSLNEGNLLETIKHPNSEKYANQEMYVINHNGYVYLVPFVRQTERCVFLKTIFKSRKMTKAYLTASDRKGKDDEKK